MISPLYLRYAHYFARPLTLVGLLTSLCVPPAQAAEGFKSSDQWLLAKYDLNGDAVITQQEVASKKQRLFARMDRDQDGGIDFSEYEQRDAAKREAVLRARFNKLDDNRDGLVSAQEYGSFMGLFRSIDRNGDGTLTAREMGTDKVSKAVVTRCLLWVCVRNSL